MSPRRPLIAGNWKMFKTGQEAGETARKLVELVAGVSDKDIMIAPPFTALPIVSEIIQNSNVSLGAQNLFWESEGAYTGEISSSMLTSAGCNYAIIGHSERRQHFGETDETVNNKINSAIQNELIPILCIGESEEQRDANETFSILDKQIKKGLEGFSPENLKTLVIAYEPIWAIGTGKTATSDQAQEVHKFLRDSLEKLFSSSLSDSIRMLYGGSVKPDNITELMGMTDIDGALVGGASLQAESFSQIVKF